MPRNLTSADFILEDEEEDEEDDMESYSESASFTMKNAALADQEEVKVGENQFRSSIN
jgi:hypothetical protein